MIRKSLYKILGLQDFASLDEIKKEYRRLALIHHPDRGGNLERMKLINSAYDILSKRKTEYDTRLRGSGRSVVIIRTYNWSVAGAQQGAATGDATNTSTGAWGYTFQ